MKKQELYKNLILKYGLISQLIVTMEECAEVIQAISKILRSGEEKDIEYIRAVKEMFMEIADCEIMFEQIKQYYDVASDIEHLKAVKLIKIEEKHLKGGKND